MVDVVNMVVAVCADCPMNNWLFADIAAQPVTNVDAICSNKLFRLMKRFS